MAEPLKLVVSPAARQDLSEIYQFSLRTWGQTRSADYLAKIKGQIWTLTTQPLMGCLRPDIVPRLRSIPVNSHVLFYRIEHHQIEIVRVLHGRQDPSRHIK